mgnify:CR=1 FL=1
MKTHVAPKQLHGFLRLKVYAGPLLVSEIPFDRLSPVHLFLKSIHFSMGPIHRSDFFGKAYECGKSFRIFSHYILKISIFLAFFFKNSNVIDIILIHQRLKGPLQLLNDLFPWQKFHCQPPKHFLSLIWHLKKHFIRWDKSFLIIYGEMYR